MTMPDVLPNVDTTMGVTDMTNEQRAIIDDMTMYAMLKLWRHSPINNPHPLLKGETGKYFAERMARLKAMYPESWVNASKAIGF